MTEKAIVKKPTTMTALRDELLQVFCELRNGTVDLSDAAECNNTAGKIINSYKVELEYYNLIKKCPTTEFIEGKKR